MWHDNRLPDWFTVLCLTVFTVVLIIRLLWRRSSAVDRHINTIALFGWLSVMIREPGIATELDRIIPAPLLFDLWHWLFVMVCVACLGALLLSEHGVVDYRRPYRRWVLVGCVLGVVFVGLSTGARRDGVNVVDGGGWAYGAYFTVYCILPVSISVFAVRRFLQLRRHAGTAGEKIAIAAFLVVAVGGALNMSLLALGAVMDAMGIHDAFTEETKIRASGELILPFVALAAISLIPSVLSMLVRSLRLDGASKLERELRPLWCDVTAAVPEVVLPRSRRHLVLRSSDERLHRTRVEIHDALAVVARYAPALPSELPTEDRDKTIAECAAVLAATSHELAAAQGSDDLVVSAGSVPPWLELEELAAVWPPASSTERAPARRQAGSN